MSRGYVRAPKGTSMVIGGRAELAVEIHAARNPRSAAYFLIANLDLEFSVSHSKQRTATLSNRKFIAVFEPPK
jgi:hypothetical protein